MAESIWNDPRITAFALGELSGDEKAKFEAEIAASGDLAAAVEQTRELTRQLQTHFAAEQTPPLDDERRKEILAEAPAWVQIDNGGDTQSSTMVWKRHGIQLAIAATLVFIVIGLALPAVRMSREAVIATGAYSLDPANMRDSSPVFQPEHLENVAIDSAENLQLAKDSGDDQLAQTNDTLQLRSLPLIRLTDPSGAPAMEVAAGSVPLAERQIANADEPFSLSVQPSVIANSPSMVRPETGLPGLSKSSPQSVASRASLLPHDGAAIDEGLGPGMAGDRFDPITDNAFKRVSEHPLSTFSIDVDTASYSKVRSYLTHSGQLPRPDAVRIEELLNYFDYEYAPPPADSEHPLTSRAEIVSCPWNNSHRLARIALKGKTFTTEQRPPCNLVFLLDTSGSMDAPNKLPLVQDGLKLLLSKLNGNDRVAIVVYAGSAGLVLDSTSVAEEAKIRRALTQLAAGGSTNGGAGITLAYQTARDHFIKDGVNRVILCTDGDFNVGTTGTDALVSLVENESKGGVYLTVLGFGMGNHNDSMLEQISGKGNGTYAYIDSVNEARKVLVDQIDSTLVTIAKDVKLQVEFNPTHVSAYRLIGYENRILAKEDFNDDQKDAGEIGAGHCVTALYEIVPANLQADALAPPVDKLKYQTQLELAPAADSDETLTVKMRYKAPDGDSSTLAEFPVSDAGKSFANADSDLRFAAAVAGFGMKLRRSQYAGSWTYEDVERTASAALGDDPFGLRAEFVELVRKASQLTAQER